MGILASIQFNCDAPECQAVYRLTETLDPVQKAFKTALDSGWRWHKRKVFCPNCAQQQIAEERKELEG